MKKILHFASVVAGVLLVAACTQEMPLDIAPKHEPGCVSAVTAPFVDSEAETRSVVDPTASPISFKWTDGDQLGIYAIEGTGLTNFDLVDGINSEVATFKHNGFKLEEGKPYYAFYPYIGNSNKDVINLFYGDQYQVADGSFKHLAEKDYQYSDVVTALSEDADKLTNFNMKHIGAVTRFQVKVPKDGTYNHFELINDDMVTGGYFYRLSHDFARPVKRVMSLHLGEKSSTDEYSYLGIQAEAEETLTLYMMMIPQDLSGKQIQAVLWDTDGNKYTKIINGRNIESGKAYGWSITMNDIKDGHEYVDLGLPSGTLWSSCNLDANTPEGYGSYWAWADWKHIQEEKNYYDWLEYDLCNGDSDNSFYKYVTNENYSYYKNNPDQAKRTDGLTEILIADDIVTNSWSMNAFDKTTMLPLESTEGYWRTPSRAQMGELLVNTNKTCVEVNGIKGIKFTSKTNGHSIFLPCSGSKFKGEDNTRQNHYGRYWTRNLDDGSTEKKDPSEADNRYAWALKIGYEGDYGLTANFSRCNGLTIRPVWERVKK